MSDEPVPIRETDPTQQTAVVQRIAGEVKKILTPREEILYIAVQNLTALTLKKDCVVATSNRLILYRSHILGQADFEDWQWQDVRDTRIAQGVFSSAFTLETVDGRQVSLGELDKEQAKRLYSVCQQMEQEWRENRRMREMEEARARSGGVFIGSTAEQSSSAPDDQVKRLARAKELLDLGLISEPEYDALRARILSSM